MAAAAAAAAVAPAPVARSSAGRRDGRAVAVARRALAKQMFGAPLRAVVPGMARARHAAVSVKAAAVDDEVAMLEKVIEALKSRKEKEATEAKSSSNGSSNGGYSGPAFNIKTFNAISEVGLQRFPKGNYKVSGKLEDLQGGAMAIMLRSHKLKEEDVPATVRCIARCGAGVNNIPVDRMTELGIPVFNTPGANANAVKELVVCALLLSSRGILEGNNHVNNVINVEENKDYEKVNARIEKDKAFFVGNEIQGKTLGVIGLGQIGGRVVNAALSLGMNVIGYDPVLSLDAAWMLPGDRMARAKDLADLLKKSDYITLHVPYIKGATHHLLNRDTLKLCKPGVHLLNFARGEIVDGKAVKMMYDAGTLTGKYVSDFSDPDLIGHPRHIVLPHLGASTEEAEENSAAMAADTIKAFLETGTIKNSVNFPACSLAPVEESMGGRLCIVNRNDPGVLGEITTYLGKKGINIVQQINTSKGHIAYTVIDMEKVPEDPAGLQTQLAKDCKGVITSRWIGNVFEDTLGTPGTFYHVTWDESVFRVK